MTALLERAIAQVRALPEDEQDAYASLLLSAIEPAGLPPIDDRTRQALRQGLAEAEQGLFADEAEIDALLADRPA